MAFQRKNKTKDLDNTRFVKDNPRSRPHLRATAVKPGEIRNPNGRPKGSRNKLGEAFLADVLADWEVAGPSAIQACRLEDPARYCAIVASIIPKDISLNDEERILEKFLEQFTTVEEIRAVRTALTNCRASVTEKGNKTVTRGKSNGVQQVLLPSSR